MPVTLVGLVYYADDVDKKVFRKVYPEKDDSELDEAPYYFDKVAEKRCLYLADDKTPHTWLTLGTDPARVAVMVKVPKDSKEAYVPMTGTP